VASDETLHSSAADAFEPVRRDFLKLVTGASAGIGVAAVGRALIDSMNPSADVIAAGAPIDIDLSKIASGQQIVVLWRGSPILIANRTPTALRTLQDPSLVTRLSDPNSNVHQQPPYAKNWHRSVKPEFAVLVGVCTHLGCLPEYKPTPDASSSAPNWPGSYLCPCHGSKCDLAGRVYTGVPAPYNLPVLPYRFVNDKILRTGENLTGQKFELASVMRT
jgi:ubiquinol-cytochrome c reductase iron-sulfur subunit